MQFNVGEFGLGYVESGWWAILITLAIIVAFVALTIVAIPLKNKNGEPFRFETRDLTYAAVCVAIAFALSFFGVTLSYGGTITLFSTVPIMIYCYYFGFRKGLIICTVYMLLQFLQNPFILHPWSALLDYIIPYMALCFFGVFSYKRKASSGENQICSLKRHIPFIFGAACYIVIRYISHVLSGIWFFAEWKMWEEWPIVPYSFAYNSFVLIDFAIAITASVFLLLSRSFNSFMAKSIATQTSTVK